MKTDLVQQKVRVEVVAQTFFGARHALETISQLWAYDDVLDSFVIVGNDLLIQDFPQFPHRGLSSDTVRNFIPMVNLKRMVDGLSFNKVSHTKINIFLS